MLISNKHFNFRCFRALSYATLDRLCTVFFYIIALYKSTFDIDIVFVTNVIKITIPQNGGHFERRAAIGRRNTPLNSTVAVSRTQKTSSYFREVILFKRVNFRQYFDCLREKNI